MVKKNKGFTLIEMVVVTGTIGMIMVSLITIVVMTFRSQNQTKSSSRVVSGGTWILNEIKRNVLSSNSDNIRCLSNQSVGLTNVSDGNWTVLSCSEDRIASESAFETIYLDSENISVIDCDYFVSCTTSPSLEVSTINFKFGIGTSTIGIGSTKNFEMDLTIRN